MGGSSPPQLPPAPPPPPSPEDPEVLEARRQAQVRERRRRGRAATIIAGTEPQTTQAPIQQARLLGGVPG